MNKNIILVILIVVIIGVAATLVIGQNTKQDTQITFLSKNALQNGEQLEFQLKDAQGNAISGKNVNLTFGDEKYSLVTDGNGKARLVISDEKSGNYNVSVSYGGDDKHNGCSAKTTISVSGGSTADSSATSNTTSTNDSSTASSNKGSSSLHYDAKYGLYYDDDGKVRNSGGQIDGMSIYDIRERGGVWNGIS